MRGDILLYRVHGRVTDWFIERFTKGPFCHVEIDIGDGIAIGAHTDGVKRRPYADESKFARFSPVSDQIEKGIKFLEGEVGNGYGFIDITNQVLKVFGSPVCIAARNQYDCSDLVTRYILITECLDLGEVGEEPHLVTPNDIGRACGLI
jgi:hypothetical protein